MNDDEYCMTIVGALSSASMRASLIEQELVNLREKCEAERKELTEWRTAKRRVFWRVRWAPDIPIVGPKPWLDYEHRSRASAKFDLNHCRSLGGTAALLRVTVRPKVLR